LSRFLSNDLKLPEEMTTSYDAYRMIIKHHCEVVWSAVISKLSIHYRGCVQQDGPIFKTGTKFRLCTQLLLQSVLLLLLLQKKT
jgi:hypothetical protein